MMVCSFSAVLQANNPFEALLELALQQPYLWAPVLSMLLYRWVPPMLRRDGQPCARCLALELSPNTCSTCFITSYP